MRIIIVLMLLLAACAPVQERPATPEAVPEPVVMPEPVEPVPVVEAKVPNPDVVQMWDRVDSLQGYSFILARLPERAGDFTYRVRGQKAVVEPIHPVDVGDWNADVILLDYETETAVAYCVALSNCMGKGKSTPVSFADYYVKLPTDWFDQIQYGEIAGTQQFNGRRINSVVWEEDGLFYEAYLDDFYGLPQRVAVATDERMVNIIDGGEYQGMQTNNVKPEDVEPPY